jgi:23S rRNA pseudouridine2605 synthase
MNQDQLHKARLTRWRQDGNALLTLDDAERWLAETPLCLYLPRRQHLPVPAPSFVEAVTGRPDPTPAPAEIAAASEMLARLVASGAVIPLNLFGAGAGIVGEQPDFLATPEALPYLYALQPQRNPKRPPTTSGASRVSPLAVEAFNILTREGALTTGELRAHLGREVTEAATLRALGELWHAMRIALVPQEHGAAAHWELLSARHGRELNIGSTQSQTTALSILVSFYLQSAVAATEDEAEIFLSPLASRSRIREVIHGLTATRQLASFPLNGEGQLYVEGTLPEIPEEEVIAPPEESVPLVAQTSLDAGLEQNEPSLIEAAAAPPLAPRRKPIKSERRPARPGSFSPKKREGGFRRPERGAFQERPRRSFGGQSERRDFDQPQDRENKFRRGDKSERGERPPRDFGQQGERRPFRRDRDNEQRPPRRGNEQRPFRGDSERRPPNREQSRPPYGRSERGASQERPRRPYGGEQDRRPFRRENDRRPFQKADRPPRPFQKREGDRPARPFQKREGDRPSRPFRKREADRPSPGANRRFEDRPPRRQEGERPYKRPFAPSDSRPPRRSPGAREGERRNRPFPPKSAGGERRERPFSSRPANGERRERPFTPRPAGGDRRPFRREGPAGARPGGNFRKPSEGGKTFGKRPAFGGRPPAKGPFRPGKPGAKRFDSKRPRSGPPQRGPRPGGFTPPRRKPRRESGDGDEG